MTRTLRYSRIIIQSVIFLILTLCLSTSALCLPVIGDWLTHIQLGYAVTVLSLSTFSGWIIVTLIFGRIYCSSVCPVGTLQDISSAIARSVPRKAKPAYSYRRPNNPVRYTTLMIMAAAFMTSTTTLITLLDPFSLYSTVCGEVSFVAANMTDVSESNQAMTILTYTMLSTAIWTAAVTVIIISISSRHGRLICNTVCPIGTTLGFVSRYSIFQFDIDTDLCTHCRKCADVCKSECIDLNDHVVDGSRCVVCFDCIDVCPDRAIRYTTRRKQLSLPMMQKLTGISTPSAPTQQTNQPSQQNETIPPAP